MPRMRGHPRSQSKNPSAKNCTRPPVIRGHPGSASALNAEEACSKILFHAISGARLRPSGADRSLTLAQQGCSPTWKPRLRNTFSWNDSKRSRKDSRWNSKGYSIADEKGFMDII